MLLNPAWITLIYPVTLKKKKTNRIAVQFNAILINAAGLVDKTLVLKWQDNKYNPHYTCKFNDFQRRRLACIMSLITQTSWLAVPAYNRQLVNLNTNNPFPPSPLQRLRCEHFPGY